MCFEKGEKGRLQVTSSEQGGRMFPVWLEMLEALGCAFMWHGSKDDLSALHRHLLVPAVQFASCIRHLGDHLVLISCPCAVFGWWQTEYGKCSTALSGDWWPRVQNRFGWLSQERQSKWQPLMDLSSVTWATKLELLHWLFHVFTHSSSSFNQC